jgi:curved DNA-binding protein CbpA
MKSAYLVLGIPGNASKADVEDAFKKAQHHYSSPKLAADPDAVDKFLEVKTAFNVLRDSDSRAAHDRKLSSMRDQPKAVESSVRKARVVDTEMQASGFPLVWKVLVALAVLFLVVGFYVNSKRESAMKEQLLKETQQRQVEAEEARKEEARAAKAEASQLRQAQKTEQQERQFRQESDRAIAIVRSAEAQRNSQELQRQSAEQREIQRKEYEAKARDQNIAREAQQRLAMDKARIRELCYLNYRRPDC